MDFKELQNIDVKTETARRLITCWKHELDNNIESVQAWIKIGLGSSSSDM
jgi:hypothetical protein